MLVIRDVIVNARSYNGATEFPPAIDKANRSSVLVTIVLF